MKQKKIVQLALVGLTHGLLINATVEALPQGPSSFSQDSLHEKARCPGSCPGKRTETRSQGSSSLSQDSLPEKARCPGSCPGKRAESRSQRSSSLSLDSLYAKGGCGHGSCPGKRTAARDTPQNRPQLQNPAEYSSSDSDPNSGNLGYHLMTEDELLLELNDEGVKQYKSLSPEGKTLAIKLASQRCAQTNSCKGQNACKTDSNDCAGLGECKGQSKCGFSDKNLAVKIAAKLMAEKRVKSLNSR